MCLTRLIELGSHFSCQFYMHLEPRYFSKSFSFFKEIVAQNAFNITYQLKRNQSLSISSKLVSNGRNKDITIFCFYQTLIHAENTDSYFTCIMYFSEHNITMLSFLYSTVIGVKGQWWGFSGWEEEDNLKYNIRLMSTHEILSWEQVSRFVSWLNGHLLAMPVFEMLGCVTGGSLRLSLLKNIFKAIYYTDSLSFGKG